MTIATVKPSAPIAPRVSREELIGRARDLVPKLRERAAACEQARRLLDETVKDLHDAGLFRFIQPARVGGHELDFGMIVDVPAELARGCASTAWNVANLASHHFMLALWPEQAQDEVWGNTGETLVAASLAFPAGRGRRVPGGYVISGRWPYSSGVDHSDWNMLAAPIRETDQGPVLDHRLCLVPKSDYEIIDTWFAAGLRGTGSKDVTCSELFVPEHRTLSMYDIRGGDHPGALVNPGPLFRAPLIGLAGFCTSGIALGNAQGAYDDFVGSARQRQTTYTGAGVSSFQAVQIKLADAGAGIEAARLMMQTGCREAMILAEADQIPDLETKLRWRRNAAFATRLCTDAVLSIIGVSGAGALYDKNPAQRSLRDAHAIAAHVNHNIDINLANFGLAAMGGEYVNPMM